MAILDTQKCQRCFRQPLYYSKIAQYFVVMTTRRVSCFPDAKTPGDYLYRKITQALPLRLGNMIDDTTLKNLIRINDSLFELCKSLSEKSDGAGEASSRLIPIVDDLTRILIEEVKNTLQ